jgi:hypothetical protein
MDFRISSPCPVSWDSMTGDGKTRFCGQCKLNVYNIAEMTREEVAAVVRETGGQLCGRLYVRPDRMATVRDCPRGLLRKRVRRGTMVVAVLLLAGFGWLLKSVGNQDRRVHPVWIQTVLKWIDPEPERVMLGRICPK